jgi:integrase
MCGGCEAPHHVLLERPQRPRGRPLKPSRQRAPGRHGAQTETQFASWLVQNRAELHEVSGALGHSSVTMTPRYAHLSKGATVAKLGGILTNMGAANGC